MNTQTDEPLAAQQIQALQAQATQALQRALDHHSLRKQCLEMAVRSTSTHTSPSDVMDLARKMYEFLIEPMQEIKIVMGA